MSRAADVSLNPTESPFVNRSIDVRIHQTLKITPVMAAGMTNKLWEISDMVKVLEEWEQSAS
jgi:hypothetical protein